MYANIKRRPYTLSTHADADVISKYYYLCVWMLMVV
jgi:hypothetical protein